LAIHRQVREECLDLWFPQFHGMNPSANNVVVKLQKIFDPTLVGLDRLPRQPSYRTGGFVLR
jgi:hypothetical protein